MLAENRPRYDLSLYLDDLRKQFKVAYDAEYARPPTPARSSSPRRRNNLDAR